MRCVYFRNKGLSSKTLEAIILQAQEYRLQTFVRQSPERLQRPQPKGIDMEQY